MLGVGKEEANLGNVTVNSDGFFGVSVAGLEEYLSNLNSAIISSDDGVIKSLENGKKDLYNALRTGWVGYAEANFEKIFDKRIDDTIEILKQSELQIEGYMRKIADAWLDQDKNMIGE